MSDEHVRSAPLSGFRAVSLLRLKAAVLEADVKDALVRDPSNTIAYLTADLALIATLLADEIERRSSG